MGDLPFPAVVDQRDLKTALLLNAINRSLGGVLIRGEKGTGKSTTVRGLKRVLPTVPAVAGCVFNCYPEDDRRQCRSCRTDDTLEVVDIETPVVELPLGATEDRVVGSLDLERALTEGINAFEPGLLARANRGILYIDEVNLLDDHLVDVLLDVAASGVNRVEREGVSATHPADFILVGTMNPDEGQLRPQLLDRFGLQVTTATPTDPVQRRAIVDITERFDRDPDAVYDQYAEVEAELRSTIETARSRYDDVRITEELERAIVELCIDAGVEGHRGDIVTTRCARTLAAYDGRDTVTERDVRTAARLTLPHRVASAPTEPRADIDRLVAAQFGDADEPTDEGRGDSPTAEDDDQPDDAQRISRAGSRDRRAETNPVVAEALDGLRAFLFGDTDDGSGEEPADTGDPDGRREASGVPLDPIGPGSPTDELDVDSLTRTFEASIATVLEQYDEATTAGHTRGEGDRRGRYVRSRPLEAGRGSTVAVDATLRAAAGRGTTDIEPDDLQIQVGAERARPFVVFSIDASASMRAHGHLETAKDLIRDLLREPSRGRRRIAAIGFRDETADLIVPPTGEYRTVDRQLDDVPTGNKTPLAHGLYAGLRVIQRARPSGPESAATLVVLTDGRPTVALETDPIEEATFVAERLAEQDVGFVIVDLDTGRRGSEVCRELAEIGDGAYVALDAVPPESRSRLLDEVVRSTARGSSSRPDSHAGP